VAVADLKKARSNSSAQQREITRLTAELGKKTLLAQANLKKIVEKFREQMNANECYHSGFDGYGIADVV
jgi:ribosomal protein L44E